MKTTINTRVELGTMLKHRRKQKDITIRAMGETLGIPHTRVADLEAGRVGGIEAYIMYLTELGGSLSVGWDKK